MIGSATSSLPVSPRSLSRIILLLIGLLFLGSTLSAQIVIEVIDIPGLPVSDQPVLHSEQTHDHLKVLTPSLGISREGNVLSLQPSQPAKAVEIMDLQGRRLAYREFQEGSQVRFRATDLPDQIVVVRAQTAQGWIHTKVRL